MMLRPTTLALLCAAAVHGLDDEPAKALNAEVHGFVSFGHLRSWANDWVVPTRGGNDQFWEAAGNVIMRPMDHLRLGAQLFARDFGTYDNGRVDLDWAYADWRQDDAIGLQVGRVKFPFGLFNESLDIDSSRVQIFLPPSIYALRTRDLWKSMDGGKLYGSIGLGGAGGLDYAMFHGVHHFARAGGTSQYFAEQGLGDRLWMEERSTTGGMLHWETPVHGLGLRLTHAVSQGLKMHGWFADGRRTESEFAPYSGTAVSTIYETSVVTLAAEYSRYHGHGETTVEPLGQRQGFVDNSDGCYGSATWHLLSWLELYGALEHQHSDAISREGPQCTTRVLAMEVLPLRNWTMKAELRDSSGTLNATSSDGRPLEDRWQVLAVKTTVDF